MSESTFSIGDLIKIRGFKRLPLNETPIGIISANLGLDKYKVDWTNKNIARRHGLRDIVISSKIELLHSVASV